MKTDKIKVVWRGHIDGATEMNWLGRHWIANEWQETLTPEESAKQAQYLNHNTTNTKDGFWTEQSLPEAAPNGQRVLVTHRVWISLAEYAHSHASWDVEGEEPKNTPKREPPKEYPNAAREHGSGEIWIGNS